MHSANPGPVVEAPQRCADPGHEPDRNCRLRLCRVLGRLERRSADSYLREFYHHYGVRPLTSVIWQEITIRRTFRAQRIFPKLPNPTLWRQRKDVSALCETNLAITNECPDDCGFWMPCWTHASGSRARRIPDDCRTAHTRFRYYLRTRSSGGVSILPLLSHPVAATLRPSQVNPNQIYFTKQNFAVQDFPPIFEVKKQTESFDHTTRWRPGPAAVSREVRPRKCDTVLITLRPHAPRLHPCKCPLS